MNNERLRELLNSINDIHESLINIRNERQREVDKIERERIKIYHIMKDLSDEIDKND